ncbi:UNVERIFIED_CONTAM: hypothetical protein HDU68_005480 [Siphonaria sp. JEL0065]|nr:hypothetical protein HDU68_005480 [Siphonaria sp. JEL0065]
MAIFTSAASFIIDDIRIRHSKDEPPHEKLGLLGGAGPFCARLFLIQSTAKALAYVTHEGRGCSAMASLQSLSLKLHPIPHPDMAHPRAWNTFEQSLDASNLNETRGFYYQTPEIEYATHFRILPHHIPDDWTKTLEYIHVCTSGDRFVDWVSGFNMRGNRAVNYIWEPSPNSCKHQLYKEFEGALECATVVSPNHEELASLLGLPTETVELELLVSKTIPLTEKTSFVIRAGARGCIVIPKGGSPVTTVPAYWALDDAQQVADVTGAGNSFLGGLMVGLKETNGDLVTAAEYGSVAASFVVQQFGPPVLEIDDSGVERWNGENPRDRLIQLHLRRGKE